MFLTFNYQYLWGYPLLALAAASLLAPGGFVARVIQQFEMPDWFPKLVAQLSMATYAVYIFMD